MITIQKSGVMKQLISDKLESETFSLLNLIDLKGEPLLKLDE